MSGYYSMREIALMVANDVWEYDRDSVEHMCELSSCQVVIDFFEAHQDKFGSDCSMQIKFATTYTQMGE